MEDVETSTPARFEKIVRMYPDRIAVRKRNQQITYLNGLPESRQEAMRTEIQQAQYIKQGVEMIDAQYRALNTEQPPVIQNRPDSPQK